MNEIWKDCKGYEGLYQVSNFGRVWSVRRQTYMKLQKHKQGYLKLCLTAKNGKRKNEWVHRLVALAFLDNSNNYPLVNHINENKEDNRVENLEWCSAKQNINHSLYRTTHARPVLQYDTNGTFIAEYNSVTEAAKITGISPSQIGGVARGDKYHKSAKGYIFNFKEVR